ncbi:MAG: helix-turn-helix transcriptional regulator [Eubacteriales bacterium]|nr:helix-turn-helix transcriptional regulator [Eubacteriales bacterium]
MSNSIGENIKKFRTRKGLTQKQLGELLGVSAQMIGQYETGVRNPRYSTVKKIASALDVLELDIIDYEHPTNKNRAEDALLRSWLEVRQYIQGKAGTEIEDESFVQFIKDISESGNFLNEQGKQVAIDRVEELTKIPDYQKKESE